MAWDEWEQLKAEAAEQGSPQMQMNRVPDAGGGGDGQGLVVQQDDLGAVGHAAFELHGDLLKQADIAGMGLNRAGSGSTMQAATEFANSKFAMGDSLSLTVEVWTSQVKTLLDSCAHISNHLDLSKKLHANDDAEIELAIKGRNGSGRSVSGLDKYLK
ncbi:hypothetical protein J7E88_33660 [Streptomyces sp. ISL-10]|uniref:hypothetical protein n=1 Tax=Streptomyces sp. ISL-10 TaxID=2819172 RepID=UPI001BEAE567|nr:hypothetical protein [Streptomyces sp. ISL-10]MBT2370085.1 hypothetical protein [Streptomyces sp. ISL-10]